MKQSLNVLGIKPIEGILFLVIIAISVALLTTPHYYAAVFISPLILILFLFGRYPQIGYYMILFMVPFDAYTGLAGSSVVLSAPRFVGLWITAVILFHFLLKRKRQYSLQSNLWKWLIIFILISFISALLSSYYSTSFGSIKKLLIAYTFFAMTLIFVSRKEFSKTFPTLIILSVSISSFLAISDYTFDLGLFTLEGESERKVGAAQDPNEFSTMIIFSLPLLAHWFFNSEKRSIKLLAVGLFAMNILAIILTYSRGGSLILACMLILLFLEHVRRFKPKHFFIFPIFIGFFIIVATVFMPHSYWERMKTLMDPSITEEDRSIGGRASFFRAGLNAVKEKPLLGFGPGTFRDYYATTEDSIAYGHKASKSGSGRRRAAHNTYIEFLVGQGLVGFIIYLAIIFVALKNFTVAKRQFLIKGENEMASLVGSFRISFVVMLFSFFLLSFYYHKYFWAALALSYIAYRLSSQKKEEDIEKILAS